MHGAEDLFYVHVFHCEPSAGPLCKTIEAACKVGDVIIQWDPLKKDKKDSYLDYAISLCKAWWTFDSVWMGFFQLRFQKYLDAHGIQTPTPTQKNKVCLSVLLMCRNIAFLCGVGFFFYIRGKVKSSRIFKLVSIVMLNKLL